MWCGKNCSHRRGYPVLLTEIKKNKVQKSSFLVIKANIYQTKVRRYLHIIMPNVTDLNIFIWCKFLRHLGKVMVLIVLALTGMTYYSTFTATIQPHITSNNDPATQAGFIILLIFYTLVVRSIIIIIQTENTSSSYRLLTPSPPLSFRYV